VQATANTGYNFVNWTEGGSEVSTSASYTFTLSANRTLVANFAPLNYAISVSASPAEGSVIGGGNFPFASSQTVTATPNAGYAFVNWTEGGSEVSTSASYTFTVSGARTLVANFDPLDYAIAVSASPPAGGSASGGGSFPFGTSLAVNATANTGYAFVNWTEGGSEVSSSASYSFSVTGPRTLVANFDRRTARNDLVVDLGSSGLYEWLNATTWRKIHSQSPISVVTGDLDGNRRDEVVAVFSNGTWALYDDLHWRKLNTQQLLSMATGDLDGNGKDEVIGGFAGSGLYALMNNGSLWRKLFPNVPQRIATGDLDGNGKDEIVAVFPGGTWVRYDSGQWKRLNLKPLLHLTTGDLDGNRKDDIVGDFAGVGLSVLMNNSLVWKTLLPSYPLEIATADINGNGKDDILAVFPSGIFIRHDDARWERRSPRLLLHVGIADLDNNGQDDVAGDFGGLGLFALKNNELPWIRLRQEVAEGLAAGGFD
jgi:hypothetical protein